MPEAPFVSQTPISSSAMNNDLSDVAAGLTGSLARDGQGGMTGPLPLAAGGAVYVSDPDTGLRRTAADAQALFCGGTDRIKATTTGGEINGDLNVTGAFTVGGAALIPVGLGPLPWSGLTAPSKWLIANGQTLLRASYPALWTFAQTEIAGGNTLFTNGNGSTTFTIANIAGRIPAGREAVATLLTATYFGGNSTVLGATGGVESRTLGTANLPPQTPSGTITNGAITFPNGTNTSTANGAQGAMTTGPVQSSGINLTALLGPSQATSTFNGTAFAGQVSTPVSDVQPTIIVNYIIYAGA